MPFLSLWIPVVVSAIVVFVASSIIHMALKYHKADMKPLPAEDAIRESLAKANPAPGQYFTPYCADHAAMKDPVVAAKFYKGPVAVLTILGREIVRLRTKMLVENLGPVDGAGPGFVHAAFTNGGSPPD